MRLKFTIIYLLTIMNFEFFKQITPAMNVHFPKEIEAQLEALVPPRQRSKFITKAVQQALKEAAKQRALEALHTIKPVASTQDSAELSHQVRAEMGQALIANNPAEK